MNKFLNSLLCFTVLFLISMLIWSCQTEVDSSNIDYDQKVTLRSETCNPILGEDCTTDGSFLGQQGDLMVLPNGCVGLVQMYIVKCVDDLSLETEYNFMEVSITLSGPCNFTQEERDQFYTMYVEHYMAHIATVTSCWEGGTTLSSYIKMNCVEACYGFSSGDGPSPVIYVTCSTGAQGCCIEKTKWCRNGDNVIQRESFTHTIAGDCSGNQDGSCNHTELGLGCIPSRCDN